MIAKCFQNEIKQMYFAINFKKKFNYINYKHYKQTKPDNEKIRLK